MLKYVKNHFPHFYQCCKNVKDTIIYNKHKYSNIEQKKQILSKVYRRQIGVELNWEKPSRYTEKLQWVKLFGINNQMSLLTDKYAVRDWVKNTIGEEYLIPMISYAKTYKEINFDKLPKSFVIKSNNSSGWNIIVKDKNQLDFYEVEKKLDYWSKKNYAYVSYCEMQYESITPVFIIEKFLEDSNGELNDYKFLCFDGEPYYCWVDRGRFGHHTRTVYDMDWKQQEWSQVYDPNSETVRKPKNFEEMVEIAKKLCKGFAHVRVDLYNVDGKIYFGEMTFTNGSGLDPIVPDEYDILLGNLFKIDMK